MAIQNPSFEDVGATSGSAANWTLTSQVTTEEYAAFDTTPEPEPVEDFEGGWGNDGYILHIDDDDLIELDFSAALGVNAEGFESAWGNDAYLFHIGSAGTASFAGGQPREDFLGRTATNGSTNVAGTHLTSVAAAFTAADIGKYVHTVTQPISQITGVIGDTATISPAWTGSLSGVTFDILEWNEVLPPF